MIHDDNENVRKERRASAGRDGNVNAHSLDSFKKLMKGEPRRDVDSIEKRMQDLEKRQSVTEAFCERAREFLREKGFDFEDGPPPAEAST